MVEMSRIAFKQVEALIELEEGAGRRVRRAEERACEHLQEPAPIIIQDGRGITDPQPLRNPTIRFDRSSLDTECDVLDPFPTALDDV